MGQAVSRGLAWVGSIPVAGLIAACGATPSTPSVPAAVSPSPVSRAPGATPLSTRRTSAVTSSQTWVAHVTQSTYQSHQPYPAGGYITLNHYVLAGKLIDTAGHDLPQTQVREDCDYGQSSALAKQPFDCSLVVETGSRTYAAAGSTLDGVFGTLTSTGGKKPPGSFKITELGSSKQGSMISYTIRISAHP